MLEKEWCRKRRYGKGVKRGFDKRGECNKDDIETPLLTMKKGHCLGEASKEKLAYEL